MRPSRHLVAATFVVLVGGGSALAQSAPPSPQPLVVAQAAPSAALSIDSPIEVLVAAPAAKAILDADIPGLTTHPMYDQFKRESLRALAPKFGGAISDKDVAKVQADLAALQAPASSR